jgi:hypothetical protein
MMRAEDQMTKYKCQMTTVIGPLENECIRNALIGI